ncbi:hypothetical protein V5T82_07465 [Magnetovibrio sp. PR-2]|uniref:hypothetical protein n=1 Tax=Magnetovibrio sp. PR-2 TaxID=3120356 RepID=UPI002FCE44E4
MDLMERRRHLKVGPNPDRKLDYLITLEGHLPNSGGARQAVQVRYVPDKNILDVKSFGAYLEALSTIVWPSPEELAVTVITDINNELIARWVQVTVNAPDLQHHAIETHGVVLEDRQPDWDNPMLLNRLERI